MKNNVGLWIDHRKAVIVSLRDQGEDIREIPSDMEKHVRFSGGAQEASAEDQRDRRFTGHLDKYYDTVVACIRDAESILILGPGEAKVEFKKRLENTDLHGQIVGIETVDKMTDNQIVAKVRQRFLK
jgi:stalled ribosome rescue protein Dom34